MAQKNKLPVFMAALLTALFILLLFAINWKTIQKNIKETRFLEIVFAKDNAKKTEQIGEKPPVVAVQKEPDTAAEEAAPVKTEPLVPPKQVAQNSSSFTTVGVPEREKPAAVVQPAVSAEKPAAAQSGQKEPAAVPAVEPVAKPPVKTQETSLYFVIIDSSGLVVRRESKRAAAVSDSPMTDAIRSLLAGPQLAETQKGYMSLIPAGTQLLSASVQNGTATLNFSENFEFNNYGVEGYFGQLMQIVFTATAFSTVNNVQFLIEGQKKEYLGSEGVWIGSPLARTSFK